MQRYKCARVSQQIVGSACLRCETSAGEMVQLAACKTLAMYLTRYFFYHTYNYKKNQGIPRRVFCPTWLTQRGTVKYLLPRTPIDINSSLKTLCQEGSTSARCWGWRRAGTEGLSAPSPCSRRRTRPAGRPGRRGRRGGRGRRRADAEGQNKASHAHAPESIQAATDARLYPKMAIPAQSRDLYVSARAASFLRPETRSGLCAKRVRPDEPV